MAVGNTIHDASQAFVGESSRSLVEDSTHASRHDHELMLISSFLLRLQRGRMYSSWFCLDRSSAPNADSQMPRSWYKLYRQNLDIAEWDIPRTTQLQLFRVLLESRISNSIHLLEFAPHPDSARAKTLPPKFKLRRLLLCHARLRRDTHIPSAPLVRDRTVTMNGFSFDASSAHINVGSDVFSHNTVHIQNFYDDAHTYSTNAFARWSYSYSPDFQKIYIFNLDARTANTGGWVLQTQEFDEWVNSRISNLMLVGKPGTGKTMSAAIAIHHLQKKAKQTDNITVSYAFFKYDTMSSQSISGVLAYVLGQLVEFGDGPRSPLARTLYEYCMHSSTMPSIEELCGALKDEITSRKLTVHAILDALDEFSPDNNEIQRLIDTFESLDIQLMATYRPTVRIQFRHTCRSLEPLAHANDGDITNYIKEQFNTGQWRAALAADQSVQESIQSTVKNNAKGTFLIAVLQVAALRVCSSTPRILEVLNDFPAFTELDAWYKDTIRRIKARGHYERVIRVLLWLLYAEEAVSFDTLRSAIGATELAHEDFDGKAEIKSICVDDIYRSPQTSPLASAFQTSQSAYSIGCYNRVVHSLSGYDDDSILATCAGIVTRSDGYLSFVHKSAKDFFDHFIPQQIPNPHRTITEACLRFLDSSSTSDYFYSYAALHWGTHAKKDGESFDPTRLNVLHRLTSGRVVDVMIRSLSTTDNGRLSPTLTSAALAEIFERIEGILIFFDLSAILRKISPLSKLSQEKIARGMTYLTVASIFNSPAVAEALIQESQSAIALINSSDIRGRTSLSYAAENSADAVITLLLKNGAEANRPDSRGRIPLTYLGVEAGADRQLTRRRHPQDRETVLRIQSDICTSLLKGGSLVDHRDDGGYTPLSYAVEKGNSGLGIAILLLAMGADPSVTGMRGRLTPPQVTEQLAKGCWVNRVPVL